MQVDRIQEIIRSQPFRPFTLRMVNGSSYLIKHPEFVALPQTLRQRNIVFFGEDGVHIIDLALIQELVVAAEPTPPPAVTTTGNGEEPPAAGVT